MSVINVTRSSMPDYEEFCQEIQELWDTRWLTNMGAKHQAFEAALREKLSSPNVALFANGHLALEAVLEAFDLSGEIITTPFTFASTTHAIVRRGCTPVFCDIDPESYTVDADKAEALITEKTTAILPVHVYGRLCQVEKLAALAEKYHLKLIYDAAHAFGVRKNGVSAAAFGDAAMFSFHATKVFHSIEGGAVCSASRELYDRLYALKNFGIAGPEDVPFVGGNAKFNEFCAAMGLCNLRHLDGEIAKRALVYEHYIQRLSGVPGLILSRPQEGVTQNYAYFPVVFDGYKYSRDQVFDRLREHDIVARKYFYPLTNSFACYAGRPGFDPADTPVAEHIARRVLTLPMYADLAPEDVDRICDVILG